MLYQDKMATATGTHRSAWPLGSHMCISASSESPARRSRLSNPPSGIVFVSCVCIEPLPRSDKTMFRRHHTLVVGKPQYARSLQRSVVPTPCQGWHPTPQLRTLALAARWCVQRRRFLPCLLSLARGLTDMPHRTPSAFQGLLSKSYLHLFSMLVTATNLQDIIQTATSIPSPNRIHN